MSLSPRPDTLRMTRSLGVRRDDGAGDVEDPDASTASGAPEEFGEKNRPEGRPLPLPTQRSMRPAMAWADSRAGMMPSVRARSCAASRAAASETAEYSARR